MIRAVNYPKAYSEVYSFINALGKKYIEKVPQRIYETIDKNRVKSYAPIFKANQTITKNSLSKEALALIAALNLQYWCTSKEEKKKLQQIYINNTKAENEKYSYENLFKNTKSNIAKEYEDEQSNEKQALVEYKESPLKKLINKIKKIFKRK